MMECGAKRGNGLICSEAKLYQQVAHSNNTTFTSNKKNLFWSCNDFLTSFNYQKVISDCQAKKCFVFLQAAILFMENWIGVPVMAACFSEQSVGFVLLKHTLSTDQPVASHQSHR